MNLYFENICKIYNGKIIFDNITGRIDAGDKIGLIGSNGVGKTTLIKLIIGDEGADNGRIWFQSPPVKILHVEQHPKFDEQISVYEEIYRAAQKDMGSTKEIDIKVKKALSTLGLTKELWKQKAEKLSGGEKTKLMLCKMMVSDFDFLVLDEPTNHLDIKSCQWLEEYLNRIQKTILVISHDRYFLDKIVNKTWELNPNELKSYKGNYSNFRIQRENEIKNIMKEYNKQQQEIKNLKRAIDEREVWFAKAHKSAGQNDFLRAKAKKHTSIIKAKERKLEKLEANKIDKPRESVSPAFDVINKNIILEKLPPFLVKAQDITKYFDNRIIFKNISFNIMRGDKISLIGSNGAGKTTLLKIINNIDVNYKGTLNVNPSVKIGYFDQELNNLDNGSTVLENVLSQGVNVGEARLLLACLLFRGDDVYKKVSSLSMGERSRVAFAKLILSGANLLVLDEPTNYMDIVSKEKIEEVLQDFAGTVILVSHDRYFIKRIANRIFEIVNKSLICYDGDYDYYLSKSQQKSISDKLQIDYNQIRDNINRLECELAFLGGKLGQDMDEEEKRSLSDKYIETAKKLNNYRKLLKKKK